jgi:hypothetical protein
MSGLQRALAPDHTHIGIHLVFFRRRGSDASMLHGLCSGVEPVLQSHEVARRVVVHLGAVLDRCGDEAQLLNELLLRGIEDRHSAVQQVETGPDLSDCGRCGCRRFCHSVEDGFRLWGWF